MEKEKRIVKIHIRFTETEYDLIKKRAAEAHLGISTFVRMVLLGGGEKNDRS